MVAMRPWTARILELVDQGTTHREDLLEAVAPWVPMGHAYRARERQRHSQDHRARLTDKRLTPRPKSMSEVHRIGARVVVREAISTLVHHGHLIRDGDHVRRPTTRGEL